MMDTDRLSEILHESASDITARPPTLPTGSPPHRGWLLTLSTLIALVAVGSVLGVVASQDDGSDDEGSATGQSREFDRVGRNGVSVEVPAAWGVIDSTDCREGGLSTNAVIRLSGSVEECMGYRAAAATRVYITDLSDPPYGEPWDEITSAARSSNGVLIRRVTSGSLVGMNSTATFAITVPDRDVAIIAAGPNLELTIQIMDSVKVE